MTLSTSARHSPIGFVPGSDVWRAALALLRDKPVLRLRGVHFHLGSGIASERPYRRGIAAAVQTLEGLYARGFSPSLLDIGGGFGAHRAPTLGLLDSIGRLAGRAVGRGDGSLAMLLPNVARQLELALAAFGERCGRLRPRVIIEPGRSLVASSQILLLTVLRTESRGSHHYAFCDAGAMSLSSSLLTEYHAIELVNRTGPRSKRTWTILGNLPTPLDRVAVLDSLPDLERGDILAVMDVGAYFLALGNTFAGPRPAIVRATPVGPELLRRRERTWDLNGRDVDVMPDDVLQSWRATG
jgi:diaminopimelate decarboxylase